MFFRHLINWNVNLIRLENIRLNPESKHYFRKEEELTLKAVIKTELAIPIEEAWELAKQSDTLVYVCKGLLGFQGSNRFPKQWKEGDVITTHLKFFGFIPIWEHVLRFISVSDESNTILTEERGGMVRNWNHEIKLISKNEFCCFYSDTVEINAGAFTPLVWLFAKVLYKYRQHRWNRLSKMQADRFR